MRRRKTLLWLEELKEGKIVSLFIIHERAIDVRRVGRGGEFFLDSIHTHND